MKIRRKSNVSMIRCSALAATCLWGMLTTAGPARAFELSHYAPGIPNIHDYFLPPPEAGEIIYAQYNVYYHSDTIRDLEGDEVDSVTLTGPTGIPRTIDLNVDIDQFWLVPTFVWAPNWNVLGGRYGAYIAIPVGNPSVEANVESERGRGRSAGTEVWDIGDIFVQPLWLMWTLPREGRRPMIDLVAAYGFDAPTGRYHAHAADNVGWGFWEHQIQLPLRVSFDEKHTSTFVLANTFEVGHNKKGVDVVPGAHYTLNWGFTQRFFDHWLEAGAVGYDTFQISNDSGDDADPTGQDQLHGAGVQLGVPKLGLSFKYYREFGAVDRVEGDFYTLTFVVPIDLLAQKVGLY